MNRKLAASLIAGFFATAAMSAHAGSFSLNSLQNLNQGEFRQLSQDLGAALSYKPLEGADALGITGLEVSALVSGTILANGGAVQNAVGGSSAYNTLPVPGVRVVKGLPLNVDIGANYSRIPDSGINLYGADLKWALLPGGLYLPALALRGSITRLDGVNQLGFESYAADVSVSKGFLMFTPYAGVGLVRSRTATDGLALSQVNLNQQKVFLGVDMNIGMFDWAVEGDSTGGIRTFSLRAGLRL